MKTIWKIIRIVFIAVGVVVLAAVVKLGLTGYQLQVSGIKGQDNTQMHMYMPTYSFINFFGNMQVIMMSQLDMIDTTDAAAVKAIYDSIDDAVETINVSFVMTKATKAL